MSIELQSGKARVFGTSVYTAEKFEADAGAAMAAPEKPADEKLPTFEETYPRYGFAPLVRLGIYLADESTIRKHAAYLWAFLLSCGGAAIVLLGMSPPTVGEGK